MKKGWEHNWLEIMFKKTCLGVFLLGNSLCSLGGDNPKENEAKIAIIPRKNVAKNMLINQMWSKKSLIKGF